MPLQVHSSSSQGYEMTLQDELSEKMGSLMMNRLLNFAWLGCDMVVTLPYFFSLILASLCVLHFFGTR